MAQRGGNPYEVLGVGADASDGDVRAAYRRLVQLHHPDHNGGSAESARRFEEVQQAYAEIRELRARSPQDQASAHRGDPTPPDTVDPDLEAHLAKMERDLREAHLARERARRAAREAAAAKRERPSDEELGYITTDDSLSKIFADARDELSELFTDAREHPVGRRVADTIDELAAKLAGEQPPRRSK
jgi:curved DNA-binding protein CbpA